MKCSPSRNAGPLASCGFNNCLFEWPYVVQQLTAPCAHNWSELWLHTLAVQDQLWHMPSCRRHYLFWLNPPTLHLPSVTQTSMNCFALQSYLTLVFPLPQGQVSTPAHTHQSTWIKVHLRVARKLLATFKAKSHGTWNKTWSNFREVFKYSQALFSICFVLAE